MQKTEATVGMAVAYQHQSDGPIYLGTVISSDGVGIGSRTRDAVLVAWTQEWRGRRMPQWIPCRFLTECCPTCGDTNPEAGASVGCETCAEAAENEHVCDESRSTGRCDHKSGGCAECVDDESNAL